MNQSLLTQAEYDECAKKYNTYCTTRQDSNPPPNHIAGDSLTPTEVKVINSRLDAVLKAAGIKREGWSSTF